MTLYFDKVHHGRLRHHGRQTVQASVWLSSSVLRRGRSLLLTIALFALIYELLSRLVAIEYLSCLDVYCDVNMLLVLYKSAKIWADIWNCNLWYLLTLRSVVNLPRTDFYPVAQNRLELWQRHLWLFLKMCGLKNAEENFQTSIAYNVAIWRLENKHALHTTHGKCSKILYVKGFLVSKGTQKTPTVRHICCREVYLFNGIDLIFTSPQTHISRQTDTRRQHIPRLA